MSTCMIHAMGHVKSINAHGVSKFERNVQTLQQQMTFLTKTSKCRAGFTKVLEFKQMFEKTEKEIYEYAKQNPKSFTAAEYCCALSMTSPAKPFHHGRAKQYEELITEMLSATAP
eukprot:GFYU01070825.1.p1 GENE.GFYU01070825.1~~GFYU01070825.1.p1  ORF type:complete len:115 (-),score=25.66 GFYU01070825.1:81-425(-)